MKHCFLKFVGKQVNYRTLFPITVCLILSFNTQADEVRLPDKAEWLPGQIYRDKDGEIKLDPTVTSPQANRNQPQRTQTVRIRNNRVRISWQAPTSSLTGKALKSAPHYKVYLFTRNHRQERVYDAGSRTEYVIQNLQQGHYIVRITAYTRNRILGRFSRPVKLIVE